MSLLSFNPLHYAERLEKTGVTREQAKVQADAITQILDEKVATKQDLEKLVTKEELKQELKDLRSEIRYLFSVTIAVLGILMTALKFFH